MNNSHDKRLDRLLEDWADKRAASEEDLTVLQQQIGKQLSYSQPVAQYFPQQSTSTRRYMAIGLAAAAVLLVTFGLWRHPLLQQQADNQPQFALIDTKDSAKAFETHWPKQLRHQERLLTEYRDLFGSRVTWVTETDHRCDVGLAAAGTSVRIPSEFIVVQLWLVARNQQNDESEVHSISVLAGREEMVILPTAVGGGQLELWAYPVDEAMVSIDLRYQPASVAGVEIDGSNLQRVGQVTKIHSFEQDGIEYQLYQAAALVPQKVG